MWNLKKTTTKKQQQSQAVCVSAAESFHSTHFYCPTLRLLTFSGYQLLSSLLTFEIENMMIIPLSERKLGLWGEEGVEFKSCIVVGVPEHD